MTTVETADARGADTLALGFGTSVAMWFVGYLGRLPPALAPSWVLALALLACLAGGGIAAGRLTGRGWRAGLAAGLLASALNLLVLGGLLRGGQGGGIAPSAVWWLPGSLLLGAALGGAGAALGAVAGRDGRRPVNWTGAFAAVAAAATLLQLMVGGVVTGEKAGLAVVDWPNSFGSAMFLYPLSRMTGGIYYEHAHRLFGSLLGLTTLVLAVHLVRVERRAWVRRLGLAALAVVIVQGILGGLRVTGGFTLSTSPAAMAPSITLAVVHGILGPAFFGLMVALAAFTSSGWTAPAAPAANPHARSEQVFAALLVGVVLIQLILGAVQRHLARGLVFHASFAVVVLGLALVHGARLLALYTEPRLLAGLGRLLTTAVTVQVMLGIGALFAVQARVAGAPRASWDVLLTTAHQAGGSVLLGCAVLSALWTRRLLAQAGTTGATA